MDQDSAAGEGRFAAGGSVPTPVKNEIFSRLQDSSKTDLLTGLWAAGLAYDDLLVWSEATEIWTLVICLKIFY